jgi:hypothetical protein
MLLEGVDGVAVVGDGATHFLDLRVGAVHVHAKAAVHLDRLSQLGLCGAQLIRAFLGYAAQVAVLLLQLLDLLLCGVKSVLQRLYCSFEIAVLRL